MSGGAIEGHRLGRPFYVARELHLELLLRQVVAS